MKMLMDSLSKENLAENVFDYMDSNGVLVQKDGDGGDSAYMTALASGLFILENKYFEADVLFEGLLRCNQSPGVWSRYPATPLNNWYEKPDNFSRDQADTVDWCFSIFNIFLNSLSSSRLQKQMWTRRIDNCFLHQNTHIGTDVPEGSDGKKFPDITSPESIMNLIRGRGWWAAYPFLWLLDLTLIIGIALRYAAWDTDCMLARNIILSRIKYPTPVSWIARQIYKRTNYKDRIHEYFYKTGNSIKPLGDLYQKICKKYIDQ